MASVKEQMLKKKIRKNYRRANMSKAQTETVLQTINRQQRSQQGIETWDEMDNIINNSLRFLNESERALEPFSNISEEDKPFLSSDFYAAINAISSDIKVYTNQVMAIKAAIPKKAGYVEPDQKIGYFKFRDQLDTLNLDMATNISNQIANIQSTLDVSIQSKVKVQAPVESLPEPTKEVGNE